MFSAKSLIPAVAFALLGSQSADAADMPWTAQDHIDNVKKECVEAWNSDDCKSAVAQSNRKLSYDYFTAPLPVAQAAINNKQLSVETAYAINVSTAEVFNGCHGGNVYDWEHYQEYEGYIEGKQGDLPEDCLRAVFDAYNVTGIAPNWPQLQIMQSAPNAANGSESTKLLLDTWDFKKTAWFPDKGF